MTTTNKHCGYDVYYRVIDENFGTVQTVFEEFGFQQLHVIK